jgi:hypothetical protein
MNRLETKMQTEAFKFNLETPHTLTLPKHNLVDIIINMHNVVVLLSNGSLLYTENVQVRDYLLKATEDKSVYKNLDLPYEHVQYNKYTGKDGFMHTLSPFMSNGIASKAFTRKLIIENELSFKLGTYNTVYYDIETVNLSDTGTLDKDRLEIRMISYLVVHANECIELNLMITEGYTYSLASIKAELQVNIHLNIYEYKNDTVMAIEFIKFLNDLQGITFAIGFNSSSCYNFDELERQSNGIYKFSAYKAWRDIGFDLPLILKRSHMIPDMPLTATCKINSSNAVQISKIRELRRCYFLDMQVICNETLSPSNRNNMETYKLNDYLKIYNIPLKLDIESHTIMGQRLQAVNTHDDISDLISYSLYDSYGLYLLDKASHSLDRKLICTSVLNVPLYNGLYDTSASNITFQLLRKFNEAGCIYNYDCKLEKQAYEGAYTYVNDDSKLKVQSNVASFDFVSQYPNTIINYNLSPECYVKTTDTPVSDDNYICIPITDKMANTTGEAIYYVYDREVGVLPKYLQHVLDAKNRHKQLANIAIRQGNPQEQVHNEIMRNTFKIIANSMYGLLGSNSCLYQSQSAIGCTNQARLYTQTACDIYRTITYNEPIMCDTDSLYGTFDSKSTIKQYEEACNVRMTGMSFEFEEWYDRYLVFNTKKSYTHLHNDKVTVKGVSWSIYTTFMRTEIKQLFERILKTGDIYGPIHDFYTVHLREVLAAIRNNDTRRLIDYAKLVKKIGKNDLAAELRSKYKDTPDDVYYTVKYVKQSKNEGVRHITHALNDNTVNTDFDRINVTCTMDHVMSSVNKLIYKFKPEDDDEFIHYRIETCIKESIVRVPEEVTELGDFIDKLRDIRSNPKWQTIHEVLYNDRPYRMFQDIDKTSYRTVESIAEATILLLREDMPHTYQFKWYSTVNKLKGNSFHVIYNVACDLHTMRVISDIVSRTYKCIDMGVYRNKGSLRSIYSCRIPAKGRPDFRDYHEPMNRYENEESIADYVLHNVYHIYHLCNVTRYSNKPPIAMSYCNKYIDTEYVKIACIAHKYEYVDLVKNGNFVNIHMKLPYLCRLCNRPHERDNQYAFRVGNEVRLRCRRNDNKQAMLTHPIEDITLNPIEILKDKLQNIVETNHYTDIHCRYIDFNIHNRVTCIKSCMGTGKTTCLSRIIAEDAFEVIIVLSFRRSFTQAMADKYKCESYMDIRGNIRTSVHKRVFIQIDSLLRLKVDIPVDLLVIDEFVSNMLQLKSYQIHNTTSIYKTITALFNQSRKVIIMDGLLDTNMLDMVKNLTYSGKDDLTVYNNTYKHFDGVKLKVYVGKIQYSLMHVYNKILKLNQVCVFCTSNNYAVKLTNMLKSVDRKVALFHGKDMHHINELNSISVSMKAFKAHWYPKVSQIFDEYDILIYTSSITGGISIEKPIDAVFGIFLRNTCTCIDFLQGIYRCRNARFTEIYYKNGCDTNDGNMTPYKSLCSMMENHVDYNDRFKNIECFVDAMLNQVKMYRDDVLLMNLKLVYGYDIELLDIDTVDMIDAEGIDYMKLWESYDKPSKQEIELFNSDKYKEMDNDSVEYREEDIYLKALVDVITIYDLTPEQRRNISKSDAITLFRDKHRWRAYKSKMVKYQYTDISDFDSDKHFKKVSDIIELIKVQSQTDILMYDTGDVKKAKDDALLLGYVYKLNDAMQDHTKGMSAQDICNLLNVPYVMRVGVKPIVQQLNSIGWTLNKHQHRIQGQRVRLYTLIEAHKPLIDKETDEDT